MWMKNTLIPLDMLFVDADGCVVKVHERRTAGLARHDPVRTSRWCWSSNSRAAPPKTLGLRVGRSRRATGRALARSDAGLPGALKTHQRKGPVLADRPQFHRSIRLDQNL